VKSRFGQHPLTYGFINNLPFREDDYIEGAGSNRPCPANLSLLTRSDCELSVAGKGRRGWNSAMVASVVDCICSSHIGCEELLCYRHWNMYPKDRRFRQTVTYIHVSRCCVGFMGQMVRLTFSVADKV